MSLPDSALRSRHFYFIHLGVPILLAVLVFLVFEFSNLDRALSNLFYDPMLLGFPLRHNAFLETVMHRWAKYVLVVIAIGALSIYLLSFHQRALVSWRMRALFIVLSMALGPAMVGLLKGVTNKHCPYDLTIYGGFAPYKRLLEAPDPSIKRGECFPGGHASGGFGLMAFYFLWYRRRPAWAYGALMGGFAYGFALGFGRLMQGAHFLSHNLWSALICWFAAFILYRWLLFPGDQASE